MKTKHILSGILAVLFTVVVGCSTPTSQLLNQLELGMTQAQVKKILGNDYIAKASKTDANGALLQLWEYRDKKTEEAYRIYFKDGQIAQWGTQGKMDFPDLILPKQ